MDKLNMQCACGCGEPVKAGRKFVHGHNQRGKPSPKRVEPEGKPPLCGCGCGEPTLWSTSRRRWNSYLQGHQHRGARHSEESLAKMRAKAKARADEVAAMNRERVWTDEMRAKLSEAKRRNPLPQQFKDGEANPFYKHGQPYRRPSFTIMDRTRKSVIGERGFKCESCGDIPSQSRLLHMHHIDDDPFNNSPDNLQLLCVPCHNKVTHGT